MTRQPAVAGQFYSGNPQELRRDVAAFLPDCPSRPAVGVVSPHAGYIFSGAIAGETLARVEIPDRVVILGPNHHGHGAPVAVYASGDWQTPLGSVPVDAAFAERLLAAFPGAESDPAAHRFEHSLEVQVPFLQVRNPNVAIVPVCLGRVPLADLLSLGETLAGQIEEDPAGTLILASSDMSHYEPGDVAREKDRLALDRVEQVDPEGLYKVVREGRISMCGVLPTVVMLAAARRLGSRAAELIRYGNSGDVTGDTSAVVGYAGVAVWKSSTPA